MTILSSGKELFFLFPKQSNMGTWPNMHLETLILARSTYYQQNQVAQFKSEGLAFKVSLITTPAKNPWPYVPMYSYFHMVRTVGTHTKLAILIQFFLSSPIHAHAFSMSEEGLCSCLSTLGRSAAQKRKT